jgi:hypothetical protein
VHKNPNIEQIYEKLFGLNKQLFSYWLENILFKTQWWITLGLLIIPLIIVGGLNIHAPPSIEQLRNDNVPLILRISVVSVQLLS